MPKTMSQQNPPAELPPRDRCINYVEFVVGNIARSKQFYGDVFGWGFTDYGPDYCEFSDGQMKGGFASMRLILARASTGPCRYRHKSKTL